MPGLKWFDPGIRCLFKRHLISCDFVERIRQIMSMQGMEAASLKGEMKRDIAGRRAGTRTNKRTLTRACRYILLVSGR
jgi:hypothetical protein